MYCILYRSMYTVLPWSLFWELGHFCDHLTPSKNYQRQVMTQENHGKTRVVFMVSFSELSGGHSY